MHSNQQRFDTHKKERENRKEGKKNEFQTVNNVVIDNMVEQKCARTTATTRISIHFFNSLCLFKRAAFLSSFLINIYVSFNKNETYVAQQ